MADFGRSRRTLGMAAPASGMAGGCCSAEDSAAAADRISGPPIAKSDAVQTPGVIEVDKTKIIANLNSCAVRQRIRLYMGISKDRSV